MTAYMRRSFWKRNGTWHKKSVRNQERNLRKPTIPNGRTYYQVFCGAGMYGNVNRKKKSDGSFYKDYYYYQCKHRTTVNGHRCGYKRQWKQELVDNAVAEVIGDLVNKPKFEEAIRQKIGAQIDTKELENELGQAL